MDKIKDGMDLAAPGLWFPLAVGAAGLLFILLMPKRRLTWQGVYLTFGVVAAVALSMDVIIVGKYFDVFDLGAQYQEGIGDLASSGTIPASIAVIYLNYYDPKRKWLYVASFTVMSFLFELVLTQVGYMKLKGWQTVYSLPFYIAIFSLWLPWHYETMKKACAGVSDHPDDHVRPAFSAAQPVMKPLADDPDNPAEE